MEYEEDEEEKGNYVSLMTLHNAKGLEFPYVFLCGMEEGLFPSYMSITAENPESEIEEERRLCYVGITRAKKELFLSSANKRMVRGETQFSAVSRFIKEVPRYLLNITKPSNFNYKTTITTQPTKKPTQTSTYHASKPAYNTTTLNKVITKPTTISYEVGDTVLHIKFGIGVVTSMEKIENDYKVEVDFSNYGVKKLRSSVANLKKLTIS
mgnify:FL=1